VRTAGSQSILHEKSDFPVNYENQPCFLLPGETGPLKTGLQEIGGFPSKSSPIDNVLFSYIPS
jgi:hypothetical protein